MKTVLTIVSLLIFAAVPVYGQMDQTPPPPSQEQPEVLTSGPVHEAYAEPVDVQLQEGVVAPKQPPANIEEAPTTQMPQGGNYIWVPGYWSWDPDRNDYIWVSACWRAAPPGMSWVPGYWAQVSDGWEWVAGFWKPANTREIEYLPPPPALTSVEPLGPAPSPDTIWVPPCQYWYNGGYILRQGYWLTPQPNWVWVPSHYIWTPRGYIFVQGHWDYTFSNRGVLFAPVYYPRPFYARRGYVFSPSIVLDIGAIQLSLFAYPRYCHYYFGDYYSDAYLRIGIYPWFECERIHTWYDPIYSHDRWRYRHTEPHWAERQRHEYDIRRADKNLRPARTYRDMETRMARLPESQRKSFRMAEPINTYSKTSHIKFERINNTTQRKITAQSSEVQKYRQQRSNWESTTPAARTTRPAVEQKGKAPSTQRREQVTTTPEHKIPAVTAPTKPSPQVKTPAERREQELIQQRKAPAAAPPTKRKEQVTTTPERKAAPPAAQPKERVTEPAKAQPEFVPPRPVRATKPERVKVPESSVEGKPAAGEKGPPSRPASEHQSRGESKQKRGDGKDQRGEGKYK